MCCSKGCQHMLTGQSAWVSCRCAVARDVSTCSLASQHQSAADVLWQGMSAHAHWPVSISQLQICCGKGCQCMITGQSASLSCRYAVAKDVIICSLASQHQSAADMLWQGMSAHDHWPVSITQLQISCSKGCHHMLTGQSTSVSWSICLRIKALHDPNSWQRCELCKQTGETFWLCYSYSIKSCNTTEVSLFLLLHKEFHLPTFIPTL